MVKTKKIDGYPFVSYAKETFSSPAMIQKSDEFYKWLDKRRTIRDFSDKPVPKEVEDKVL